MTNNGQARHIILHLPSLKPLGLFMLSIQLKRSRVMMRERRTCASLHLALKNLWTKQEPKSKRSSASLPVFREPAKHWSGSTLQPDAETWANPHMLSFFQETARLSPYSVKLSPVTKLHVKRVLAFKCGRERLPRASKHSSKTSITFATMHCWGLVLR